MADRKVVRVGPSHYHVGHIVPAMVAKEMTYFEQEGLKHYDLHHGGLLPAIAEKIALRRAMTEKGVDITPDVKPSAVFAIASRGEDVHIVGCWRNKQDFRWYGAKDVRSLSDVKGKRFGIRDFGGIDHATLRFALKRQGFDPEEDVQYIRGARFHPHENPEASLRSGEVDIIHLSGEDDRGLLDEGYSLLMTSADLYPKGHPDRVSIATSRMVNEDSDLLVAYFRAIIRAYWFITDYERNQPYLEALVKRLRMSCLDEEEAGRAGLEGGGRLVLPMDGAPSEEGLYAMVDEAKELGDLDDSFELKPILRLEFVRQAYAELEARPELRDQLSRVKEIFASRRGPVPA